MAAVSDDIQNIELNTNEFQCKERYKYATIMKSLANQSYESYSPFYITNVVLVTLNENVFKNCYTSEGGGVFKLEGTTLTDFSSTFLSNILLYSFTFYR